MSADNTNGGNARHKEKFASKSFYNKLLALKSNRAVTTKASQQPNDADTSLIPHMSSSPCDLDHSYTISLFTRTLYILVKFHLQSLFR